MNILFLYDHKFNPEAGGTERATKLVYDELERRGHHCFAYLYMDRNDPSLCYFQDVPIASLAAFLETEDIDIVINQIAYHKWLLEAFLNNGGSDWQKNGGRIISFMHFDPDYEEVFFRDIFRDWDSISVCKKIRRLCFIPFLPRLRRTVQREKDDSYKYIYDKSDAYIVMSPSYISKMEKHARLKDTKKIHVITNMLTFTESASPDILNHKDKSVLVVARLDENQKKISTILKVWNRIKDHSGYTLNIVGTGKDEKYYKEWVSSHNISDVIFHGQQSPLQFYQKAEIFLMSSPSEGWGLTITESYQNAVVPVVLNTSSVFKDIIEEGATGFLPNTISEFKNNLEYLLNHPDSRKDMGVNALKRAQMFSPLKVGNCWEMLFKKIK